MPQRPAKVCRVSGCSELVTDHSNKGYCLKHKDKADNWAKHQAKHGNRHQRGYGWEWEKLRKVVLKRDAYLCQSCKAQGKFIKGTHVDHIKPKSQGGSNASSNLQTLCVDCHSSKTGRESGIGAGQKSTA